MSERCPTCKRPMPVKVKRVAVRKVRSKPRRGPMRDATYRRWCACEPCAIGDMDDWPTSEDGCDGFASDPAHTQNNGMRSKGPDSSCVPLCRKHHEEYDAGRAAFEAKYRVDMRALAAEHYERFLAEIVNK